VSEIKDAFKALTPEQQQLVQTRRVQGERTPDEWLRLLGPVAAFDRQVAHVRGGGGGFFARRFAKKHDIPDGLRLLVMPLLPILREDHDPHAPLALRLDMTGAQSRAKLARNSEPYRKGAYYHVVDSFYDDAWLQGTAQFADGAQVTFAVTDHVRSSRKTKKSASGRTKRKTKAKKKTEIEVTVSLPASNYDAGGSGRSVPKQSVKAGAKRTVVKTGGVLAQPSVDAVPAVNALLELIAAAYERVDPARRKRL
jgi:hypothetical protein